MSYGKELILDLHDCNPETFSRQSLSDFLLALCHTIDMERQEVHFWDYEDRPEEYASAADHLKGTSVVQFISTSNITIHTLDVLKKVFINLFSCKDFDTQVATELCVDWFKGRPVNKHVIERN
jgi:S-adenosylmethionine/arginine decarboxylase-like enzyme